MGTPGILSRQRGERIRPLELGGGNGAPLDVGGTLVIPLQYDMDLGVLKGEMGPISAAASRG